MNNGSFIGLWAHRLLADDVNTNTQNGKKLRIKENSYHHHKIKYTHVFNDRN